jgi:hypothetical protein
MAKMPASLGRALACLAVPVAAVIAVLLAVIVAVGLYVMTFVALVGTLFDLLQRWIAHDISSKAKARTGPTGTTSRTTLPHSSPIPQPAAAPPDSGI